MARRKSKTTKRTTQRQRESQQITRKKAQARFWAMFRRRTAITFAVVVAMHVIIGGWWVYDSGHIERMQKFVSHSFWQMTVDAGFKVEQVYLNGRKRTPKQVVEQAINVKTGDAILRVSVRDIHARLEGLPEVRSVSVVRELPGALHITLVERQPVAIWQNKGKHVLIDADGTVLEHHPLQDTSELMVLVGEDVPTHAEALLRLMATENGLAARVASAVRVGGRRWNIQLKDGINVMLPEQDAETAWAQLATMQHEHNVLARAITTIDMRIEDRIFMTLDPMAEPYAEMDAGAQET